MIFDGVHVSKWRGSSGEASIGGRFSTCLVRNTTMSFILLSLLTCKPPEYAQLIATVGSGMLTETCAKMVSALRIYLLMACVSMHQGLDI